MVTVDGASNFMPSYSLVLQYWYVIEHMLIMNLKANELLESECGATCYVQSKGFIACKDEKCRTSCDLFVHFHPAEKYLHSTHLWLE